MLPLIIAALLLIAFALHKVLFTPLPSPKPAAPAEKLEEKVRPFGGKPELGATLQSYS